MNETEASDCWPASRVRSETLIHRLSAAEDIAQASTTLYLYALRVLGVVALRWTMVSPAAPPTYLGTAVTSDLRPLQPIASDQRIKLSQPIE
jgi:hypothetical protein